MISTSSSEADNIPAKAINLMEAPAAATSAQAQIKAEWFTHARFGLFVHYGLYSIPGRGEWVMYYEKIPAEEYNELANEFRAEHFDPDELVALAKKAGAGYIVLGARHHEGFCLWDTKTTDFNSVKAPAGRDLVREYVDSCRRAGLRVGLYYSIMSWQWPAIFHGPAADPEGWESMVKETHEQLRELMTEYGKMDYLWYDGCVVPGLGDAAIRAKYWRSRELNSMIRRLQPDILINDRAALPEDVTTPEQHLTAAPRGRLWECCQTMGTFWGWHHEDGRIKSAAELIEQMIFCARYAGNFLLNVGPYGDGCIPLEQVARLEVIGRWMSINGDAIRGSERTPYTEAQHLIGSATCRGKTLYFHLTEWPKQQGLIAGIKGPIASLRLLGYDGRLSYEQSADGCVTIHGLPTEKPLGSVAVLEMKLAGEPSRKAPPSLLVEHDTGRHDPAEAPVNTVRAWEMTDYQALSCEVPTKGVYHLELGVISEKAQMLSLSLDRHSDSHFLRVECGNYPTALRVRNLLLSDGIHEIALSASKANFSLYLWRLQPVWRILGPKHWRTIGPFPTEFRPQGSNSQVREALLKPFPPERDSELSQTYDGASGRKVEWAVQNANGESVNLGLLCGGDEAGVCYARTIVISPDERDLSILLSCDWWANLFVNGRMVRSERSPSEFEADGAWFNGWKPTPARVSLQKGENIFLVKCHPGSTDNWFTFYLNDPGDLSFHS